MSLLPIDKLFNFEKGTLQSSKCEPGKYTFITASADWKTHKEYSYDCEALVFAAAASGSLGRTHYIKGKFIASDLCFILTPKDQLNFPIDLEFYHILFNELKDDIVSSTKAGTSKEAIGLSKFGNYKLPYFEIGRQREIKSIFIVATQSKNELTSVFTTQLDLLKQLRQSFLREAMQGKLVPQNPKDEPADELLKKIRVEKDRLINNKKLRQGKIQEPELQNEIIFNIPDTWEWCMLDDVCMQITDGTHQTPFYTTTGRIFLSAQNIKPFKFMPEEHKFVSEEAYLDCVKNKKAEKGDILVARVGAGIGEAAVIDRDIDFAYYVSLGLISPFKKLISSAYLTYVINSPYGIMYSKGNISSKGGSAGNFNLGRIRSFLIPLPPIAEQNRIVAKLEVVMKLCDALETSINQSMAQTQMLMQAALKEALQPKEVEV